MRVTVHNGRRAMAPVRCDKDAASAQVMPRHRGKQMGISVPKKGKGTTEGYVMSTIGQQPLCVGDKFVEDAGWKEARQRRRSLSVPLE